MIKSLIDAAVILHQLEHSDKADVLREMLDALVASGRLPKKHRAAITKALLEREKLGSTGIGNGVAVPHVKVAGLADVVLTLARHEAGIDYDAIDGRPVHTVFLLVGNASKADEHLQVLRWISGLARNPDFRRFALAARDDGEMRELLHEMSATA